MRIDIMCGAAAIAAALIVIATTYSISKFSSKAVESMARQPEITDKIQASMITPMSFMEAAALLGIGACCFVIYVASTKIQV